ncbi:helix-turn-helix domain-containing protein [Laspinema sp. A4]|uniref:helix-turn-helix domain-containing protein n=1 Tax=Laspinema sp. D2d TaxID=2953686 RepID=UPI0021BB921A|nr:helix-turn-helix domain-containing protein [Laspinema sp. D2d]MCT7984560.1 helix-turn-helix domain-containing protein [Laspinema sp. D2d]
MALDTISQATLPQEELTAILTQIESELYRTNVYRTALGFLKQRLGESAEGSSMLLQAVAKKAIWLTLKQWISPGQNEPEPMNEAELVVEDLDLSLRSSDRQESQALEDIRTPESHSQSLGDSDPAAIAKKTPAPFSSKARINLFQSHKKQQQSQQQAQILAHQQQWADRLTQIGQQLQAARCDRGLSILDLHKQTLVPCRHIEAIENGYLSKLPEDVYVRSFIHKIGDVLGLEGAKMANVLPVPPKQTAPIHSWHPQDFNLDFSISPLHLYVGYTALMAGAIGGLGVMNGQSAPTTVTEPDPTLTAPARDSHQGALPMQTPGITSGAIACAISEIAPPEALEW